MYIPVDENTFSEKYPFGQLYYYTAVDPVKAT